VVSLLSIWVLVALFYYLNRYTRRHYFTIWTAAWLFYALWLTIALRCPTPRRLVGGYYPSVVCGHLRGLPALGQLPVHEIPARETLFGFFMLFLLTWSYVSPSLITDGLLVQLPIFTLIGLASMFAGASFYRLRKRYQFVAAGLLFLGFSLWGIYLGTYPFALRHPTLVTIASWCPPSCSCSSPVSMIVLVLEEVRYSNEQMLQQIQSVSQRRKPSNSRCCRPRKSAANCWIRCV